MDPISASIVAGGSLISGGMNNAANSEMQKKAIEWESKKMKNAHQWETQDLMAAGLNPILSAGGEGAVGSGAPMGGSNPMPDLGHALQSSAMIDNIEADTKLKDAQSLQSSATTAKTDEERKTIELERKYLPMMRQMEIELKAADTNLKDKQRIVQEATRRVLESEGITAEAEAKSAKENRRGREIRDWISTFVPFAAGAAKPRGKGITIVNQ